MEVAGSAVCGGDAENAQVVTDEPADITQTVEEDDHEA
jgi:hypothetical protein